MGSYVWTFGPWMVMLFWKTVGPLGEGYLTGGKGLLWGQGMTS